MRLVYILGSGRSGSTVLERVLGTSANAVAVGEFHCFWRMPAHDIICSCGQSFDRCGFWTEVVRESGITRHDMDRLRELESTMVRNRYLAQKRFSLEALHNESSVKEFLARQWGILEAVSSVSGKETVIDSSKAGPRGWLLALDERTKIIQVTRSAKDVFPSWMLPKWDKVRKAPMDQKSLIAAAFDWWRVEQSASMLSRRVEIRRVDYASFVADPIDTLEAAGITGANGWLPDIPWIDDRTVQSNPDYHSLNGNPDRYDGGAIQIVPRPARKEKLSRAQYIGVRVVGGILDWLYL